MSSFRTLPADRPVRWGVLGVANIAARLVVPGIQSTRQNQVVAIASRDADRARQAADQLGIPRAHASYEALLDDDAVDAVYVPLPNALHAEWTVRAARAGKHVLCEKPMALTVAECEAMLAACRDNRVLFMEGLMYRLHPQHAEARRLVATGLIGQPKLARATFCFAMRNPVGNVRLVPELGGGALWDLGVYCVDSLRVALGRDPASVAARVRIDPRHGVDTHAVASLDFGDGSLAEISASFEVAGGGSYELVGAEGTLVVHDAYALGSGRSTRLTWSAGGRQGEQSFPAVDQYALEAELFARALQTGEPPPISPDAGVANVAAIAAMLESGRTGRAVELAAAPG